MTEEIKEILDYLKDEDEYYKKAEEVIVGYGDLIIEKEDIDKLLDYITNLQQDLDKAIDTIEKDRQFYKCRMDEYVDLKKENEELNRMCELYSKSLYNAELTDYKSRLEKASNKLDSMFANGEENKILDDLLELYKIVKGDK